MTSKYALFDTGKLRDRFHFTMGLPKGVKPRYNIGPTSVSPVILMRDDQVVVDRMAWGLVNQGAKDLNSVFRYKTYNVLSEKLLWTHSREMAVRTNRCIVPVNGYYEIVTGRDGVRAYYIERADKKMFGLAGIYSEWIDPEKNSVLTYSVITTRNNDDSYPFDRRPNILDTEDEQRWINGTISDTNSIFEMLKPYPVDQLVVTEVNAEVAMSKTDSSALIVAKQ